MHAFFVSLAIHDSTGGKDRVNLVRRWTALAHPAPPRQSRCCPSLTASWCLRCLQLSLQLCVVVVVTCEQLVAFAMSRATWTRVFEGLFLLCDLAAVALVTYAYRLLDQVLLPACPPARPHTHGRHPLTRCPLAQAHSWHADDHGDDSTTYGDDHRRFLAGGDDGGPSGRVRRLSRLFTVLESISVVCLALRLLHYITRHNKYFTCKRLSPQASPS